MEVARRYFQHERVTSAIRRKATGPCQSLALPSQEQLRIQRLETLADLWGELELFHPHVVTQALNWDQVLVAVIPKIEAARSREEFVTALNESLFQPLGDPLTFARTAEQGDRRPPRDALTDKTSGLLAPGIGYLNARDPFSYRDPLFPKSLSDAVQSLGPLNALIVDLRWCEKQETGGAAWPVREKRSSGETRYYLANHSPRTSLRMLVRLIRARWSCE